ncbi:hypothetical protein [Flavobacterium alkalisoli]|uniref:hypothetical protein n=1 Tax=Flavobacterium alkalisoli TaxID=2602769 RepID=UPI003A9248F2
MSTLKIFNNLHREHAPMKAMEDAIKKTDYFLNKIEQEPIVDGQDYIVPFELARHTNVKVGGLTAVDKITRGKTEKGKVVDADYFEAWGTISFEERDIRAYKTAKKAFMTLFPDKVEGLKETMRNRISVSLLEDGSITRVTAVTGTGVDLATGKVKVSRPERLEIGDRLELKDASGANAGLEVYVKEIDMDSDIVTFASDMALTTAVDLSSANAGLTESVAVGDMICLDDYSSSSHETLGSMLDSANATIHGLAKSKSPILQAQNFDFSAIDKAKLIPALYKIFKVCKQRGKITDGEILLPLGVFFAIGEAIEADKGRRFSAEDASSGYGFESFKLKGKDGSMRVTGIVDLDQVGYVIDWSKLCLATNEFFTTNRELGNEPWDKIRTEEGYKYILDIVFRGALVCKRPSAFAYIKGLTHADFIVNTDLTV